MREAVFIAVLPLAMPAAARGQFRTPADLVGTITFLSMVLRLWTIAGEVMLTTVAHAADARRIVGRHVDANDPAFAAVVPTSD